MLHQKKNRKLQKFQKYRQMTGRPQFYARQCIYKNTLF